MRTRDLKINAQYAYSRIRERKNLVHAEKATVLAIWQQHKDARNGVLISVNGQEEVVLSSTLKMPWAEWQKIEEQRLLDEEKKRQEKDRHLGLAECICDEFGGLGVESRSKVSGESIAIVFDELNAAKLLAALMGLS